MVIPHATLKCSGKSDKKSRYVPGKKAQGPNILKFEACMKVGSVCKALTEMT